MEYVYLVNFAEDRIITVVQDKEYYYLLDNTEITIEAEAEGGAEDDEGDGAKAEPVKDYKSVIMFDTSLAGLVSRMSGSMRKKLKLKPIDKIKLKATLKQQLAGVVPVDFIDQPHIVQVKLFRDFAKQTPKRLDLSGLFILEPKVLEDTATLGKLEFEHEEIVLYQNNRFHKFEWLKHFPKIKTLSLWYINQVQNDDIQQLAESAPGLEILEIHYCYQLNGRIIIPISKLEKLDKVVINNEKFECQELAYETVITDDEWKDISNSSLSLALIDSHNLTHDFIDLFLKSFKKLEHFIINEITLGKLEKNSANGCKDREKQVSFHSVKDTKVGFKRYRDVKVFDQVRDKCSSGFSDAMLQKIKERSPEKADAAESLMSNGGGAAAPQ
jgi:hypothetical protein